MIEYPFDHDGPVYSLSDDVNESVYYGRNGKKYTRTRANGWPSWEYVAEREIDADVFWMVVACIERKRRHA